MPDTPAEPALSIPPAESLDPSILLALMDTLPDRIHFKDVQGRLVRVNQAYGNWHGIASPELMIGKTDSDLYSTEYARAAQAEEREIIRTGQPLIAKMERLTLRDGTVGWGSTTKMVWRDATGCIIGTFGLTRDTTTAKQALEKLTEERNLLRTIIDLLPSRIFVKDAASHYILNNLAHLRVLGLQSQDQAWGRTTSDFFPGDRGQQALADDRQVLSGGTPILSQEKSDFGAESDAHWSLTTKVPLCDDHKNIIGLVGISHDITERKHTQQELQRRTDEMEADLRMARQIQEAFFPRSYPTFPIGVAPEASVLRFAHRYLPAATLGGDFFDIIPLSNTRCGILVCDVMGHGVRAGLLTALIRGGVEEMGPRADNPAHVLGEINRSLLPIMQQTGQPVFATAFYAVIDTIAGTLTYGNAGHPPPQVRHAATGAVEPLALADPEPATGILEGFVYSNRIHPFGAGDMLIGYTDGLFEPCDTSGEMFGEKRLQQIIAGAAGVEGVGLIERLVGEVVAFTGHAEFEDDICVVIVEAGRQP